jgi:hypothetical protein
MTSIITTTTDHHYHHHHRNHHPPTHAPTHHHRHTYFSLLFTTQLHKRHHCRNRQHSTPDMTGDGTKTGVWGKPDDNTVIHTTVTSSAPPPPQAVGTCRVTVANDNLHASNGGYSAWTVSSGGSPRQYTEHQGDYCDCTGHGSCESWPFHAPNIMFSQCQAKCDALNCRSVLLTPTAVAL